MLGANLNAMTPREIEILNFIAGADMGMAIDRCRRKRDVSERNIPLACTFLRQYLFLKAVTAGGMEIIDQAADNLWHHWILHTRQYREFNQGISAAAGREVWLDHGPYENGDMTRQPGREVFFANYRRYFGRHYRDPIAA
tara:strand:+ start:1097 stop:1516 length:420 start_codon:yes stop_codon:yes gene_type:complete